MSPLPTTSAKGRAALPAAPADGIIVNRRDIFDNDVSGTQTSQMDSGLLAAYEARVKQLIVVPELGDDMDRMEVEPMEKDVEEEEVMAFPLFAGGVQSVVLHEKPAPVIVPEQVLEFDATSLQEKFASVAVTANDIYREASIPWPRHFCTHKVLHIPWQATNTGKKTVRRNRPGKRHRDRWQRRRERLKQAHARLLVRAREMMQHRWMARRLARIPPSVMRALDRERRANAANRRGRRGRGARHGSATVRGRGTFRGRGRGRGRS
jgi:hypothetical protein